MRSRAPPFWSFRRYCQRSEDAASYEAWKYAPGLPKPFFVFPLDREISPTTTKLVSNCRGVRRIEAGHLSSSR